MISAPAILEFDLAQGTNVDAIVAAKALIEWSEAIKEVGRIVDPTGAVSIDLVSAEPACLRFSMILRFVEQDVLNPAAEYLETYPRLKRALALNVLALPGMVIGGLAVEALKADDDAAAKKKEQVEQSTVVQNHVRNFFTTVQSEPSIQRVVVRESKDGPAVVAIDRQEFAERSGLWDLQMDDAGEIERKNGGVWNVVVTHPVAIAKPLTWGFTRDGLAFRAKMADGRFLSAIKAGTLPIALQEGIVLEVRVSFKERLEGHTWKAVPGSYLIEEVISPKL